MEVPSPGSRYRQRCLTRDEEVRAEAKRRKVEIAHRAYEQAIELLKQNPPDTDTNTILHVTC